MGKTYSEKWLSSKNWKGVKERRKPYIGGKAIDSRCRNNGGCDWCKGNRLHSTRKREPIIDEY